MASEVTHQGLDALTWAGRQTQMLPFSVSTTEKANDLFHGVQLLYRSDFCWSQFNIVEADMSGVDEINCVKPADGPAQRYNVLGQPVGDDYHGIVIENGKKILVP